MNIIKLACGDYTAEINLSRGANCISLKNSKYNASILREPDYSRLDNPFVYGMPVLFPVNRISGAKFVFEGREYIFPVTEEATGSFCHGTLHEQNFELVSHTDNTVCCSYRATKDKPYLMFPHEFEIKITYELTADGLKHITEVTNLSDKNMPCFIGFHTTFNILFSATGTPDTAFVYADISDEYERDKKTHLPTGKKLDFDDVSQSIKAGSFKPFYNPASRHYRAGTSGKMEIYDTKSKLKVVYTNDEKYMFRLIFNGASDGFICLEPQTCMVDCANSRLAYNESGFDYIKPYDTQKYISHISLCEIN